VDLNKKTKKQLKDDRNYQDYVDLEYKRMGQDVRYALNDDKLRQLGWEPKKNFDNEIQEIVDYYKSNFKW
jgi:dTDP-D-glucose 4,6-dehydratase